MKFRLTAPRLREDDVESACLGLLAYRGYYVVRLHAGLFRTADARRWIRGARKGTPDYIAIHAKYPGFFLETKRPGAALSAEQEKTIFAITKGYGLAVATVDCVEDLAPWLDAHEQKQRLS